jgi:hypothetical protein
MSGDAIREVCPGCGRPGISPKRPDSRMTATACMFCGLVFEYKSADSAPPASNEGAGK